MAEHVQALIVGAGPVGLTAAAELHRQGVRFRQVEKAPERTHLSKALVAWPRTMELLEPLGLADRFVAAGLKAHGANIHAGGKRLAHVSLDEVPSHYNYGLMIPQSETERILEEHLASAGLAPERRVELTALQSDPDGATATLTRADGSTEEVRADWLLACDGSHSFVRKSLGVAFAGSTVDSVWALADVQCEGAIAEDEINVWWHREGILAAFPIVGRRFRFIADFGPGQHPPGEAPSLEDFQKVVDQRGPGGLRLHDPVWLAFFRINERKVTSYRHGRCLLLGDAAHIHSPAGGQGMNTGMQDAFNLGWKLGQVVRGRGPADLLLDSYSSERSAVGDYVLANAGNLTRVATMRNPVVQDVRNFAFSFFTGLEPVRQKARATLTELDIHYRTSPLSEEHRAAGFHGWLFGGLRAGDRAPDGPLSDGSPERRLYELLNGRGWHLLLFEGMEPAHPGTLAEAEALVRQRYGDEVEVLRIRPEGASGEGAALSDPGGHLHHAYGAGAETLYLLRPDKYVGFRSQPASAEALGVYLGRVFTGEPAGVVS